MSRINKIRAACFLFALFLVAIVYCADTGIARPVFDAVRALPLGVKVSHFFLMGTMSTLANLWRTTKKESPPTLVSQLTRSRIAE